MCRSSQWTSLAIHFQSILDIPFSYTVVIVTHPFTSEGKLSGSSPFGRRMYLWKSVRMRSLHVSWTISQTVDLAMTCQTNGQGVARHYNVTATRFSTEMAFLLEGCLFYAILVTTVGKGKWMFLCSCGSFWSSHILWSFHHWSDLRTTEREAGLLQSYSCKQAMAILVHRSARYRPWKWPYAPWLGRGQCANNCYKNSYLLQFSLQTIFSLSTWFTFWTLPSFSLRPSSPAA